MLRIPTFVLHSLGLICELYILVCPAAYMMSLLGCLIGILKCPKFISELPPKPVSSPVFLISVNGNSVFPVAQPEIFILFYYCHSIIVIPISPPLLSPVEGKSNPLSHSQSPHRIFVHVHWSFIHGIRLVLSLLPEYFKE